MNRKLTVKKERLAELSTEELSVVAGASGACYQTNLCTTAISCTCPPTYWVSALADVCQID